jgi:hypothetical protein
MVLKGETRVKERIGGDLTQGKSLTGALGAE